MFFHFQFPSLHFLTFAGSVAVSAMFRALLRTPTVAAGEKAAADPQRSVAIASFMMGDVYGWIMTPRKTEDELVYGSPPLPKIFDSSSLPQVT
jgi:hypothetical protein